MADVLVVAVFDDERAAWDAVIRAAELSAQGEKGLKDACLVVRGSDGKVHTRETHDISPAKAGWYGGAWGLVGGAILGFPLAVAAASAGLGVFAARRRDFGVTDEFDQAVAEKLEPGKAAAVVLVEEALVPRVDAAAQERGAWTTTVTLADVQSTATPK
jgi:uncharacterized membrane protein